MQLVVDPSGTIHTVYGEAINLNALGLIAIRRASWVEPDAEGRWTADLSPVGGPVLSGFDRRSEALAAEQQWLEVHWLTHGNVEEGPSSEK